MTEVRDYRHVVAVLPSGETLLARCPQHVSTEWLSAAVSIAPVDALVFRSEDVRPVLWGIFPDERHDAVRTEVTLRATTVKIDASEGATIVSGKSRLELEAGGEVVLRGREIVSRASEVNHVKGARVRIN